MSDNQQRLVYAIIEFLNESIKNGTVKADDKESLEVAIQCIGEAFSVDPSNPAQAGNLSIKPANLQTIFDVFMKTREKVGPSTTSSSQAKGTSAADKSQAEKHKQDGNNLMSSKKYDEAIAAYDKAVALDSTNPVYYSNRAAAHSSKGDHLAAIGDAEQAISLDPNFSKAYHRLGHAQYSLGDYQAAADAFDRGLKLDPTNASLKSGLQNSQSRISTAGSSDTPSSASPGSSPSANTGPGGFADLLGSMGGGGGGGGGMPDLASLMNNPQMMAMAQQLASSGGLANLMQNPAVANMMSRVQNGDMPSMQELMNNPALRDLAGQFAPQGRQP